MMLKIGISGKRFLTETDRKQIIVEMKAHIDVLLSTPGVEGFIGYSSLAIGADSVFADLVLHHYQQQLHVILPFPIEQYKTKFSAEDQLSLTGFLAEASKVETILQEAPANEKQEDEAYLEAGKSISDQADDMLIVWDKLKPTGLGGTADILGFRDEKLGRFKVFEVSPKVPDKIADYLELLYQTADNAAKDARDRYNLVWQLALVMAWSAVVLFAYATGFHLQDLAQWVSAFLETLLVCSVFLLVSFAKKKNYHGKYLEERLQAERFRLFKLFYNADIELELSNLTKKENVELTAIVEEINRGIRINPYRSRLFAGYAVRKLLKEQIAYHEGKIKGVGKKQELLEGLNGYLGMVFLLNVVCHLLLTTGHHFSHITPPEWSEHLITFLSISLPASYAAIEGFVFFQDYEAIKRNSEDILENLKGCGKYAAEALTIDDPDEFMDKNGSCVKLIANTMLSDNHNWHLILENKNNYHWIV